MTAECFQINKADNVATLLHDTAEGAEISVRGESDAKKLHARQAVRTGHKIAVKRILAGERVVKYGFPIGLATQTIAEGDWVHLHNCRSLYDAGSSSLDIESGSRTETRYA